jgi:hypothetical protein
MMLVHESPHSLVKVTSIDDLKQILSRCESLKLIKQPWSGRDKGQAAVQVIELVE